MVLTGAFPVLSRNGKCWTKLLIGKSKLELIVNSYRVKKHLVVFEYQNKNIKRPFSNRLYKVLPYSASLSVDRWI